jgi:hypothetical protein
MTSPNSAEVSNVSALITGLTHLQSVLGTDNVATLLISHGDGSNGLRNHLCGSVVELGTFDYSPLFQTWQFVAWPAVDQVVGHSSPAPIAVEHDGWRWCAQVQKPARLDYLNRFSEFLRLLDVRVFEERALKSEEELEIRGVSMRNLQADVIRLVSREFLLHMQGHDGLPSLSVLHSIFPCHCNILVSTGTLLPCGVSGGEPCGTSRWCHPCETALSLILTCPHVAALTDVCKAWIDQCVRAWLRMDTALVAPA